MEKADAARTAAPYRKSLSAPEARDSSLSPEEIEPFSRLSPPEIHLPRFTGPLYVPELNASSSLPHPLQLHLLTDSSSTPWQAWIDLAEQEGQAASDSSPSPSQYPLRSPTHPIFPGPLTPELNASSPPPPPTQAWPLPYQASRRSPDPEVSRFIRRVRREAWYGLAMQSRIELAPSLPRLSTGTTSFLNVNASLGPMQVRFEIIVGTSNLIHGSQERHSHHHAAFNRDSACIIRKQVACPSKPYLGE